MASLQGRTKGIASLNFSLKLNNTAAMGVAWKEMTRNDLTLFSAGGRFCLPGGFSVAAPKPLEIAPSHFRTLLTIEFHALCVNLKKIAPSEAVSGPWFWGYFSRSRRF